MHREALLRAFGVFALIMRFCMRCNVKTAPNIGEVSFVSAFGPLFEWNVPVFPMASKRSWAPQTSVPYALCHPPPERRPCLHVWQRTGHYISVLPSMHHSYAWHSAGCKCVMTEDHSQLLIDCCAINRQVFWLMAQIPVDLQDNYPTNCRINGAYCADAELMCH